MSASPEKFQRKTLATFNSLQLRNISDWITENKDALRPYATVGEGLSALIPDAKQRKRYEVGFSLVMDVLRQGKRFEDVHEVILWQTGPQEEDRLVEWKFVNLHYSGNRFKRG